MSAPGMLAAPAQVIATTLCANCRKPHHCMKPSSKGQTGTNTVTTLESYNAVTFSAWLKVWTKAQYKTAGRAIDSSVMRRTGRPQTLRFRHQVCASAVDLRIEVCHHLNIITGPHNTADSIPGALGVEKLPACHLPQPKPLSNCPSLRAPSQLAAAHACQRLTDSDQPAMEQSVCQVCCSNIAFDLARRQAVVIRQMPRLFGIDSSDQQDAATA